MHPGMKKVKCEICGVDIYPKTPRKCLKCHEKEKLERLNLRIEIMTTMKFQEKNRYNEKISDVNIRHVKLYLKINDLISEITELLVTSFKHTYLKAKYQKEKRYIISDIKRIFLSPAYGGHGEISELSESDLEITKYIKINQDTGELFLGV